MITRTDEIHRKQVMYWLDGPVLEGYRYWLEAPRVNKIRTCPHICYGFWGSRCFSNWNQVSNCLTTNCFSKPIASCFFMLGIHPDDPDENIGLWKMVLGSEWRENKSSSGILFSFKLTFTSIFWACIQLNDSSPYSFSLLNPGFHFLEKIWWWWGECGQGKDKAATSQTLKLCRKRKGGKGGFLHLRNYDTEKQKQKGFKICYCKIPRSPITGCVFLLVPSPI